MSCEYAIILGGNALNKGIVEKLQTLRLKTIVVDYRENIELICDKHIVFDAKNPEISTILRRNGIDNIKIVYTSMDNAGLAQRAICKEYGLMHAPKEAMEFAHNKNLMHKKWAEAGLLNRKSFALKDFSLNEIKNFNFNYKTIIKPSDNCASRGITILEKNSDIEELEQAFNLAKQNTTNNFVNIEEFVDGTEYTVEMVGDNFGNVAVFGISKKYHTQNIDNNKVAIKLHYNANDVTDETMQKIANYGIKCYKALGLKNTLGHLEVILKENGEISPIEIGARSSGFIASHLAESGTNKIFLEEFMKVLNGAKTQNGLIKQNEKSSMYYFYDMEDGLEIKKPYNLTDFLDKNIKSLSHDRNNLCVGKKFHKLTQDTDRYGYEILVGNKNILTIENILNAETKLYEALKNG